MSKPDEPRNDFEGWPDEYAQATWDPVTEAKEQGDRPVATLHPAVTVIAVIFFISDVVQHGILVYRAGKWILQSRLSASRRPSIVYDPKTGYLYRRQRDGSYRHDGTRRR